MSGDLWGRLLRSIGGRPMAPVAARLGWNVRLVGPSMVLRQKPNRSGQRPLNRSGLAALIEVYPDLEKEFGWIINSEVWWDPVVSIEDAGVRQVWDLSVGETENFVADDLVVHNSTMSLMAAAALAEAAGRPGEVVLIDANTAQSSMSTLLSLRHLPVPDITRLVEPPWDPRKVTQSLTIVPETHLHVLFAPHDKRNKDIRNVTPQLFRRIVNELRTKYRYIVIDTPVAQSFGEPIFDDFVFTDADDLVVVTNPGKEAMDHNIEFAEIATDPVASGGRGFPRENLWIMLNRAKQGVGFDDDKVRDDFRQWKFAGAIPEHDDVLRASNDSRLHLGDSPVRTALWHTLANLTGNEELRPQEGPKPSSDDPDQGLSAWRKLLSVVGIGG